MKTCQFLALAIAAVLVDFPLLAQETIEEHAPDSFSLEFPGGTPHELIEAISKASGKPVNFIVPESGRELPIPAFKVSNVTTVNLLGSLQLDDNFWFNNRGVGVPGVGRLSYSFKNISRNGSDDIWIMRVNKTPSPEPQVSVKPVNISRFLDHYTVDDISTAIQLAWEGDGNSQVQPEIKYHPETKLMIVSGDGAHIQLMESVIDSLTEVDSKDEAPADAE